jgi:hypothetical protein
MVSNRADSGAARWGPTFPIRLISRMSRANHPGHARGARSITMITTGFILTKDFYRIGAKTLRDNKILRDH